jgi:hypothetical protein
MGLSPLNPQANEAAIPLDHIEQALLAFAIPGHYGSVRIHLKLLPTAVQAVMLDVEQHRITGRDVSKTEGLITATNERYNRVRSLLSEQAHEFRVICPVIEVVGQFQDGKMEKFEIGKAKEMRA